MGERIWRKVTRVESRRRAATKWTWTERAATGGGGGRRALGNNFTYSRILSRSASFRLPATAHPSLSTSACALSDASDLPAELLVWSFLKDTLRQHGYAYVVPSSPVLSNPLQPAVQLSLNPRS